MKAYKILILAALATGTFFSCQDEEDWTIAAPQVEEQIRPSFRLYAHGTSNSINSDLEREDRVEEILMAGASTMQNAGGFTTFQLQSYKGKKDLFFAANVQGTLTHQEFNTKQFDATPYVMVRGEGQLKLPMVATLRAVECRTTPAGTELYQGATQIGTATPVELKRVFARVDIKLVGLKELMDQVPGITVQMMNLPKYFTLASPINNYDLLAKSGKYMPLDLTQTCMDTEGQFSVYIPEHYVSSPEFGMPDDDGMTYLSITMPQPKNLPAKTVKIRIGTSDPKQPDFGQISRNKIYKMAYTFEEIVVKDPDSYPSGFAN